MLPASFNSTSKDSNTFDIYIDVFDKGELNRMIITRSSDPEEYQVNFEDSYIGTLSHRSDDTWELIKGSIPAFIISDIVRSMKRHLKN